MKSSSRLRLSLVLSVAVAGPLSGGCSVDGEEPPASHVSALRGDRQRSCTAPCSVGTVCDEATNLCVTDLVPPRLIFPVSGDRVTGRPQLRWAAAPTGGSDAVLEICKDAACTMVVDTVSGTGAAMPATALPQGAYFVRAFGQRQRPDGTYLEGATPTAVRVFFSTGRSATSKGALGIVPDIDRDGRADLGVSGSSGVRSAITVSLSSRRTVSVNGPTDYPFGVVPNAFSRSMIFASDTDGDGYTEVATIEQNVVAPKPIAVLRFGYDPVAKKLVQRQRLELSIPSGQQFVSLTPLGDVDSDGFADVGVVRSLPPVAGPSSGSGTVWYQTGVELEILYGSPAGWSRRSTTQIESPAATRTYASSPMPVRGVGDIDGDGFADIAVGIQTTNPDSCLRRARGRVELRRGSSSGSFSTVLATITDYFDPRAVGDVNGDGYADVGVVRDPHEVIAPIPPSTSCEGSYRRTGYEPGQVRILLGAAAGPLAEASYTMPVETVPGCTNGFAYGPTFLVSGSLSGAGDLDGDGLDDVAFVSRDSHLGGADKCDSGGSLMRILSGSTAAALSVAQTLGTRDSGYGDFTNRVRIVAASEAADQASVVLVGPLKTSVYRGARGTLSLAYQLTTSTYYGEVPLGGF
jgi:hypothetical protein